MGSEPVQVLLLKRWVYFQEAPPAGQLRVSTRDSSLGSGLRPGISILCIAACLTPAIIWIAVMLCDYWRGCHRWSRNILGCGKSDRDIRIFQTIRVCNNNVPDTCWNPQGDRPINGCNGRYIHIGKCDIVVTILCKVYCRQSRCCVIESGTKLTGIADVLTLVSGIIPVRIGATSKLIGIVSASTITLTVTGPPTVGVNVDPGDCMVVNIPEEGFIVPDAEGETVKTTGIPFVGILPDCVVPSE